MTWTPKVGDVVRITVEHIVGHRRVGDKRGHVCTVIETRDLDYFFVDVPSGEGATLPNVQLHVNECEFIGELASLAWHAERATVVKDEPDESG